MGWLVGAMIAVSGCAAAGTTADAPPPKLDAPWVATEMAIVNAMLDAARVGPNDVVFDLGCGDGRIVIMAAKRGARGVGVDIDPARIREANGYARRAGVTDRVSFAVKDIFETDVTSATVVALYLSPELNLRLRPKLLRELRPGSRIVSHEFDMGDWRPERSFEVRDVARPHKVFLWTVPAR
jgi:SAM-dependent methyltransferase